MKVFLGSDNISELVQTAMDKMKAIIDSSTVIGEKVITEDGSTIIPISKVTVGYVVGGGEYRDSSKKKVEKFPMTGGSSGGISVTPVGFLIESNGEIRYISVENKTAYQTVLNVFNALIKKIEKEMDKSKEAKNEEN